MTAQELKNSQDTDILAVIEKRVAGIEETGYPTERVLVPTTKAFVDVYKIGKLKEKLDPSNPKNLVDIASLKYDEQTQALAEQTRAQIELLQQNIKNKSYEFVLRGFDSDTYTEAI
jgi:hypothetical protein